MSDFQLPEFLTYEEVAQIDQALMTAQDKFLTRITLYSLRALKQIAQAEHLAVDAITEIQIFEWIEQDQSLQQLMGQDSAFQAFFTRLALSALTPLRQIASETETAIEDLTVAQVVAWFEQRAKLRLGQ